MDDSAAASTHDPFIDLRRHSTSTHADKRRLNVVLSAVEEIVKEQRPPGKPTALTPIEYFAGLMAALDGSDLDTASDVISLMVQCLPYTPAGPLRSKFKHITETLAGIGQRVDTERTGDKESPARTGMLRHTLECMAMIMCQQDRDASTWATPTFLRTLHFLLRYFEERRSKIRRAAHVAVVNVLQPRPGVASSHALAPRVADYCLEVLRVCSASQDSHRALHLLGFLQEAVPYFPVLKIPSLVSELLVLYRLGNVVLSTHVFRVVTLAVVGRGIELPYKKQLLDDLCSVRSTVTGFSDADATWATAVSCLARDVSFAVPAAAWGESGLSLALRLVIGLCAAQIPNVVKASVDGVRTLLDASLGDALVHAAIDSPGGLSHGVLCEIIEICASIFDFRFQHAWKYAFSIFESLISRLGQPGAAFGRPLLLRLVQLHDSLEQVQECPPGSIAQVEEVVGRAIAAMGPQQFLDLVPLNDELDSSEPIASSRVWLLVLLKSKSCLATCSLDHFREHVLERANHYDAIRLEDAGARSIHAKTAHFRVLQLWSLLPVYCINPVDIGTALPVLTPALIRALTNRHMPEVQGTVCNAVQTLVNGVTEDRMRTSPHSLGFGTAASRSPEDLAALTQFSRHLLPELFHCLERNDDKPSTAEVWEVSNKSHFGH